MQQVWPLILAGALFVALAAACDGGGGDGTPGDGDVSPTLAPTPQAYTEAPEVTISADGKYFANVEVEGKGTFRIELRPDIALQTVNSFIFLAREGYFDGVTFHRVLPGFVAQTGDPTGTGSGGPGYTLPAEFSDVPYARGAVGMARGDDINSAGSQFFIAYAAEGYEDVDESADVSVGDTRILDVLPFLAGSTVAEGDGDIGLGLTTTAGLNGLYTVFGQVVEGMEVVDAITPRDPQNLATPQPAAGDRIITITIEEG
jgi:peptidylprolyl isomerase